MLLRTLSRTLIVLAAALTAGCVLYGSPEDIKTCEQVVCGANATCGGEEAACFCDAGYSGNPYDGCVATQPEVDASCSASCGQFAYCSEGGVLLRTRSRAGLIRLDAERHDAAHARAESAERLARLKSREREVLRLLAQGQQLREIAQQLEISPRTVEVYKARMMEKLGCRTLADVVRAGSDLAGSGG